MRNREKRLAEEPGVGNAMRLFKYGLNVAVVALSFSILMTVIPLLLPAEAIEAAGEGSIKIEGDKMMIDAQGAEIINLNDEEPFKERTKNLPDFVLNTFKNSAKYQPDFEAIYSTKPRFENNKFKTGTLTSGALADVKNRLEAYRYLVGVKDYKVGEVVADSTYQSASFVSALFQYIPGDHVYEAEAWTKAQKDGRGLYSADPDITYKNFLKDSTGKQIMSDAENVNEKHNVLAYASLTPLKQPDDDCLLSDTMHAGKIADPAYAIDSWMQEGRDTYYDFNNKKFVIRQSGRNLGHRGALLANNIPKFKYGMHSRADSKYLSILEGKEVNQNWYVIANIGGKDYGGDNELRNKALIGIDNKPGLLAFPSPGLFPIDFMNVKQTVWTLDLDAEKYDVSEKNDLAVEMYSINDLKNAAAAEKAPEALLTHKNAYTGGQMGSYGSFNLKREFDKEKLLLSFDGPDEWIHNYKLDGKTGSNDKKLQDDAFLIIVRGLTKGNKEALITYVVDICDLNQLKNNEVPTVEKSEEAVQILRNISKIGGVELSKISQGAGGVTEDDSTNATTKASQTSSQSSSTSETFETGETGETGDSSSSSSSTESTSTSESSETSSGTSATSETTSATNETQQSSEISGTSEQESRKPDASKPSSSKVPKPVNSDSSQKTEKASITNDNNGNINDGNGKLNDNEDDIVKKKDSDNGEIGNYGRDDIYDPFGPERRRLNIYNQRMQGGNRNSNCFNAVHPAIVHQMPQVPQISAATASSELLPQTGELDHTMLYFLSLAAAVLAVIAAKNRRS